MQATVERSTIRVLVVDDFEPFRAFVCSALQNQEELQVIGEASDGLDAVQAARLLQPDLILLDIGLPKLNGIEAARQIREITNSKILFVSENRSHDIAEEVMRTGAAGYVVKSNAGSELLPAVNTVIQGKQFVSACLLGRQVISSDRTPSNAVFRHEVEFYPDDAALVEGYARFVKANLRAGNVAVVIATESHGVDILQNLKADGVDVEAATEQGNYIQLDAAETLATFIVNDMPDRIQCEKAVTDLTMRTAEARRRNHARVAICGEGASRLLVQGNPEAAIQLECLWDEIIRTCDTDTLCGYLLSAFPEGEDSSVLQRICAVHSAVHSG